jgi:hypothetical protein
MNPMIIGSLLVVLGIGMAVVTHEKKAILRIPSLIGAYLSMGTGAILFVVNVIKAVFF